MHAKTDPTAKARVYTSNERILEREGFTEDEARLLARAEGGIAKKGIMRLREARQHFVEMYMHKYNESRVNAAKRAIRYINRNPKYEITDVQEAIEDSYTKKKRM